MLLDGLHRVGSSGSGPCGVEADRLAVPPDDRKGIAADPVDIGSATEHPAAASAASAAFPPRSSARSPARAASGWLVATIAFPPRPEAGAGRGART